METALVVPMDAALVEPLNAWTPGIDWRPEARLARLADGYLAARGANTAKTYRNNLLAFARFLECPSAVAAERMRRISPKTGRPLPMLKTSEGFEEYQILLRQAINEAAGYLATRTRGEAFELVQAMQSDMRRRELSAGSVACMVTTLVGVVNHARNSGLCDWTLPDDLRPDRKGGQKAYRDTRGPGVDGVRALLAESIREPWMVAHKRARLAGEVATETRAAQRGRETLSRMEAHAARKSSRDVAILWLMAGEALRRGEVASLDLAHVDLAGERLAILGKGHTDRKWITISPETVKSLSEWIDARGDHPGPLFPSFDRAGKGSGRLSGVAIWQLVRELGRRAGLGVVRPHGFRHTAITRALDLCGGDIVAVQAFSRHADLNTLRVYDDNRLNRREPVSRLVGASYSL